MAVIWADPYYSQADKTKLLVALAIADSARSEDGRAWPGIEFIARKSRCSGRAAQLAVQSLEKDGKLTVERGAGPSGTNVYLLCSGGEAISPVKPVRGEIYRPPISPGGVKSAVRPFHPIHKEPPIEPSGTITPPPPVPKRRRSARAPLACVAFAEFWKAYPRREAKANAEKAWVANNCAPLITQILVAVRARKVCADWTKEGGRFIPHPATWLNRRGWEDEIPAPPSRNGLHEHIDVPIFEP